PRQDLAGSAPRERAFATPRAHSQKFHAAPDRDRRAAQSRGAAQAEQPVRTYRSKSRRSSSPPRRRSAPRPPKATARSRSQADRPLAGARSDRPGLLPRADERDRQRRGERASVFPLVSPPPPGARAELCRSSHG